MLPPEASPGRPAAGFSLIELLAGISVLVVLALLSFSVFSKVAEGARNTGCVANLAQVGAAVQLYANDHDMELPGPLYSNQSAWYSQNSSGALAMYLATYAGMPPPDAAYRWCSIFSCPSWKAAVSNPMDRNAQVYHIIQNNALPSAKKGSPFGYPGSTVLPTPMKLMAITHALRSTIPAITDINLSSTGKPAHKTFRNTLYFDWHVESLSSADPRYDDY